LLGDHRDRDVVVAAQEVLYHGPQFVGGQATGRDGQPAAGLLDLDVGIVEG
jgi:hypothetical protein